MPAVQQIHAMLKRIFRRAVFPIIAPQAIDWESVNYWN